MRWSVNANRLLRNREVRFSASYLHQTVQGEKGLEILVFTIIINSRSSLSCIVARHQFKHEGHDI